jgi:hypothetical protein
LAKNTNEAAPLQARNFQLDAVVVLIALMSNLHQYPVTNIFATLALKLETKEAAFIQTASLVFSVLISFLQVLLISTPQKKNQVYKVVEWCCHRQSTLQEWSK